MSKSISVSGSAGAIVLLTLAPASATHAQTRPTTPPTAPSKPSVSALLADLSSPDSIRRRKAAVQIGNIGQQDKQTIDSTLLAIAKRQMQKINQANAARGRRAVSAGGLTSASEERFWAAQKPRYEITAWATALLGVLQVEEAIPFLVENIQFADLRVSNTSEFSPYRFPCLGALMTIGLPAADALVQAMENDTVELTLDAQAMMLARITGPHAAAGIIEDRISLIKSNASRSEKLPGPVIPVPVRTKRLEAVRTKLKALFKASPDLLRLRSEWKKDHTLELALVPVTGAQAPVWGDY